MIRNIISSKIINKTFLVCHNGNNFNLIKKLAFMGNNVCILNSISKNNNKLYKSIQIANTLCDITKRNSVIALECDYQHIGHIQNIFNEVEDNFKEIDGVIVYKKTLWEKKLLIERFIFNHDRYSNIFITEPDLY